LVNQLKGVLRVAQHPFKLKVLSAEREFDECAEGCPARRAGQPSAPFQPPNERLKWRYRIHVKTDPNLVL
jgi:hypothetical protein